MKSALILVDLQNDFLPGGPMGVPEGDQTIPVANRLMPAFDVVVATKDWHPVDHGSFAGSHPDGKPGDRVNLNGLTQILWPVHCVQDTPGAELAPGLETRHIDRVFPKGIDSGVDSYSGFFDNGKKRSTGLADYLRDQEVTDVHVMGLATDYCVRATVLHAVELGFDTHLVTDGCRGVNLEPNDVDRALEEMETAGVHLVTSDAPFLPEARRP